MVELRHALLCDARGDFGETEIYILTNVSEFVKLLVNLHEKLYSMIKLAIKDF